MNDRKTKEVIIVKYGELMLKGKNQPQFLNTLKENMQQVIQVAGSFKIQKGHSVLYLEPGDYADIDKAIHLLQHVFGIVLYHRALRVEKEMQKIKEQTTSYFNVRLKQATSFKLETRRADKSFPYSSHDINTELGDYVFKSYPHLEVDVHNPDVILYVNIRKDAAYLYSEKFQGPGGLPVGTGGRATALLSGGIDSPLAAWLIARRGVALDLIHFYSYPYTSERSKNKVIELSRQLARYTGELKLYVFPFTAIQEAIQEKCPPEQLTIIMRRQMMRASEKLAIEKESQALVTGESIGQVASQTLEGLTVTNSSVDMPVFRPLIGMDKEEIVNSSRGIGTYNISIQPYTDCCTIFVPEHPQTKPKLYEIQKSEESVDFDPLIEEGLKETEEILIKPDYT
jgi:thiamine biosynthesis protein ThiI